MIGSHHSQGFQLLSQSLETVGIIRILHRQGGTELSDDDSYGDAKWNEVEHRRGAKQWCKEGMTRVSCEDENFNEIHIVSRWISTIQ